MVRYIDASSWKPTAVAQVAAVLARAPAGWNPGRVAMAIEAFHKASLVHDDIQDDDLFRYGRETLHRSEGLGPAINIGDYLIGLGYRLVERINWSFVVNATSVASAVMLGSGQRGMRRDALVVAGHRYPVLEEVCSSENWSCSCFHPSESGGLEVETLPPPLPTLHPASQRRSWLSGGVCDVLR